MSDFRPAGAFGPTERTSTESADIRPRALVALAIGIVLGAILLHAALWGLYRLQGGHPMRQEREANLAIDALTRVPPPGLQPLGAEAKRAYLAEQEHLLTTYGWVDRKAGYVRIPIARAMRLMVAGGPGIPQGGGPWPPTPAVVPAQIAAMALQVPAVSTAGISPAQTRTRP